MSQYDYEREIIQIVDNVKRQILARPLNLGGVAGLNGGGGGPTGGYIGQLPQSRVTYDMSEAMSATGSGSLVDNLNHIRYRLHTVEQGGPGSITVKQSGTVIASGITVVDFVGATVSAIGQTATVTISGGGGGGSSLDPTKITVTTYSDAVSQYPFTPTGLQSAVNAAGYLGLVELPPGSIGSDTDTYTVSTGMTIKGKGGQVPYVNGKWDLSGNVTLQDLFLFLSTSSASTVYHITCHSQAVRLVGCTIDSRNNGTGRAYMFLDGHGVIVMGCNLLAFDSVTSYRNYELGAETGTANHIQERREVLYYSEATFSSPPTVAQLNAQFYWPAPGFAAVVNSAGGATNEYLVWVDNQSNWWCVSGIKLT